jgi:Kef-type K+ transport system membrane component KefB
VISAFITDVIGTHSIFGAFVYGLVIPNGPLGAAIIEKLEDFVSGLLLPIFYAISGLKTNINLIHIAGSWPLVFTIIPLACFGKVLGTLIISILFDIPTRDGIVLGLLMNTKGLIEMIVLNIGREQKVNQISFIITILYIYCE